MYGNVGFKSDIILDCEYIYFVFQNMVNGEWTLALVCCLRWSACAGNTVIKTTSLFVFMAVECV